MTNGNEPSLSRPPRGEDVQLGGGSALLHLIDSLNHSDPAIRKRAAFMLAARGDSRAYEALMRLYEEGERSLRPSVLRALGKLGDARAFDVLVTHLADVQERRPNRIAAAEALGDLGDARAVEPLMSQISKDAYSRRAGEFNEAILEALLKLRDARSVAAVLALLNNYGTWSETRFAPRITEFLNTTLGDQSVPRLLEATGQRQPGALRALVHLGDPSALPGIMALFKQAVAEDSPEVRPFAYAISQMGTETEVDELLAILQGMNPEISRPSTSDIFRVLGRIGGVRAVEPLIGWLETRWDISAATALGEIGDARAIQPLIAALEKSRNKSLSGVEINVLLALASLMGAAAIPHIEPSLPSKFPHVRKTAIRALRQIGSPEALTRALTRMHDPDLDVRLAVFMAIRDLYGVDPRCQQLMVEYLLHGDDALIRQNAARVFGERREVAAIDALRAALHDQAEYVRHNARRALRKIGTPEARAALREPLNND